MNDRAALYLQAGNSLGSIVGSVANWDRNKKVRNLQDQHLEDVTNAYPNIQKRADNRLQLDFNKLGFDQTKHGDEMGYKYDKLTDIGVGRQHDVSMLALGGMNKVDPTFTARTQGLGEGDINAAIASNRSRIAGNAGATAGASAGARDSVAKRRAMEEELGRWVNLPENKGVPVAQLREKLHALAGQGVRPTKPSNIISPEMWEQRQQRKDVSATKKAIMLKAGDADDIRAMFPNDPAVKAAFEGQQPSPAQSPAAPPPPASSAPPAIEFTPAQTAVMQQLQLGPNPDDWDDEDLQKVLQAQ